jgi:hypothetical protein
MKKKSKRPKLAPIFFDIRMYVYHSESEYNEAAMVPAAHIWFNSNPESGVLVYISLKGLSECVEGDDFDRVVAIINQMLLHETACYVEHGVECDVWACKRFKKCPFHELLERTRYP